MREVSVRILHFALDLARAGGVDENALTEGLRSVVPVDGEELDWFDWDDLVEIIERLERSLGGPDGVGRAMRDALPVAYPEIRAFGAVFIKPVPAFRFVVTRLLRTMYRNFQVDEIELLGENCVRWRQTIPEPFRASAAFHRGTTSFVEVFPRHLDLAEARVLEADITPRTAEFVVEFPASDSLTTRSARAMSSAASVLAVQLDEVFTKISQGLRADPLGNDGARANGGTSLGGTRAPAVTASAGGVLDWAERLALSPRQRDVFALLVEGRANKDIAGALRCSERNVEFHVGRILRAARVTSRAELLVKVLGARA